MIVWVLSEGYVTYLNLARFHGHCVCDAFLYANHSTICWEPCACWRHFCRSDARMHVKKVKRTKTERDTTVFSEMYIWMVKWVDLKLINMGWRCGPEWLMAISLSDYKSWIVRSWRLDYGLIYVQTFPVFHKVVWAVFGRTRSGMHMQNKRVSKSKAVKLNQIVQENKILKVSSAENH